MKNKRLLFSTSFSATKYGLSEKYFVVGSDANYYNRGQWRIIKHSHSIYIFENRLTKQCLYSTGQEITGDYGCERGINESNPVVGTNKKNDNRIHWRLVLQKNVYLIQSMVNFRFILSTGEKPLGNEGGWLVSPKCVMSDDNYDDRALWEIN